jgi:hypothetical protein
MFLSITKLFYLDNFFAHTLYLLPNKTTMPLFFYENIFICLDGNNNDPENLLDNNERSISACTIMYVTSF